MYLWKTETGHGAHRRDETQERGNISQTRCPLRGLDSGRGTVHKAVKPPFSSWTNLDLQIGSEVVSQSGRVSVWLGGRSSLALRDSGPDWLWQWGGRGLSLRKGPPLKDPHPFCREPLPAHPWHRHPQPCGSYIPSHTGSRAPSFPTFLPEIGLKAKLKLP